MLLEMMFFGFIIWIVCAVAGGMVASSKGLSGCAGLAAGFFLGPIGLIIVAVWPPSERAAAIASHVEPGAQMVCPYCRSLIPQTATVCRFCQRDVGPPSTPPALS